MFEKVKLAVRKSTSVPDEEIKDLIAAALADLGIAGIKKLENDPLILRAVITYCKVHLGDTDDYNRLKPSYDEQKAQLRMATNYTDWGEL